MKKQITYPKFIPRIFAMVIDLTILSIVLAPLMNIISQNVMVFYFQDFFQANGIDTSSLESLSLATTTPEFAQYLTASKFFAYSGTLFIINTIFMGVYFVFFWRKFGATPGKIIMRMRVVNAEDYSTPTTFQLIKRFLGYITALIGIWTILFSKKGLALHDKIAGTVVIKS
jgi:uncharacterized RDD family membrane protein YckC